MNIKELHNSENDYTPTVWVYAFLSLLGIITTYIYLNFPSGFNQGLYHYQGLVMKNGGLPYTGFIEKKGPMGLLTYGLASIIFGDSSMAYRAFDLIILTITAGFLFKLVQLNYPKWISWFVTVVWFSHLLIEGPGNTGDVTNIITCSYVALAYHLASPKGKYHYIIAGVIIAIACWVKPTALLISMPLIALFFNKHFRQTYKPTTKNFFALISGLLIPSAAFTVYLLISGTFPGFWEAVVIDPLFNYAEDVSRFSMRVILKTGGSFLNDPVLRIGGLLSLFILPSNTIIRLSRLLVLGIGLMLFIEGRFFPYHLSILWPFLSLGLAPILGLLYEKIKGTKFSLVLVGLLLIMAIPTFSMSKKFVQAGVLSNNFNASKTFLIPEFAKMYDHRQPVISYLNDHLADNDEVLVLGTDPNIYLGVGKITTSRLARDGYMFVEKNQTGDSPAHLNRWRNEYLDYMASQKADWIIVLKTLPDLWIPEYASRIEYILSEKYERIKETDGHFIYRKL